MKRIFFAIMLMTLMMPALRQADAGVEVSVDFFYDNLGSDGSWVELEDYGYCWQPRVAVSRSNWRPYADGYWAYTDVGWTWVSNEDFGWATYHYGRWTRLRDHGWFWVPGREWGPAWVSWRTGGDYVGWAPLPPHGGIEVVYESRPIGCQVDVEFDIGPDYYNFVNVRYIGEPILLERIFEPGLNFTYVTQTVNVTNITYVNSTVYNYGPDYNQMSRYSTRPIRRMTLEREANRDLSAAVMSKELIRVQGDKLIVAAPLTIQKPSSVIAPRTVKEKITKPRFEHGWGGVSGPKAQADLKQKIKNEDPKAVLPPSIKPHDKPATMENPVTVSPPLDKGPNKEIRSYEAPAIPHQPPAAKPDATLDKATKRPLPLEPIAPPRQEAPADNRPKRPLPPERVAPPQDALPDIQPKRPLPSVHVSPPDVRPKQPLPPERVPLPAADTPPAPRTLQPLPPERVRPPKMDAPSDIRPNRPLPPQRVAPPRLEAPSDAPPVRVAPPMREAPPSVPQRQPPLQRLAPPPGPAGNGPVKTDAPRSNRPPDKKAAVPTPPTGL